MKPALSLPIWTELKAHAESLKDTGLSALFQQDTKRAGTYQQSCAGLHLDYSKNFFDSHTEQLMVQLMTESGVVENVQRLFLGEKINTTEDRAALHTLLRASRASGPQVAQEFSQISETLDHVETLSQSIRSGRWLGATGKRIRHIIHVGIGGSYLGPKMVDEALSSSNHGPDDISCDYVANVDAHHISAVLDQCDPETTLVIIVSKSFSTLETRANAVTVKNWLAASVSDLSRHLIAVSTNTQAAVEFGVGKENILPMWDWVGGRYSVWSAVGLPIAIRYGFATFKSLLAGAQEMDEHFLKTSPKHNMPMILGFLGIFYQRFFEAASHAVLTYDHRLRYLPDHLQQVDMESNGKSVALTGEDVSHHTGMLIWGGEGTNGQHAFHQLLHQGSYFTSIDFIMTLKPDHDLESHHDKLIASCLSQSQALMMGRSYDAMEHETNDLTRRHKVMPGNRPSNTIAIDQLNAHTTGALISLYEHKVFVQAQIWDINPFDQWGVELGKELGETILDLMSVTDSSDQASAGTLDGSTQFLLSQYLATKKTKRT